MHAQSFRYLDKYLNGFSPKERLPALLFTLSRDRRPSSWFCCAIDPLFPYSSGVVVRPSRCLCHRVTFYSPTYSRNPGNYPSLFPCNICYDRPASGCCFPCFFSADPYSPRATDPFHFFRLFLYTPCSDLPSHVSA